MIRNHNFQALICYKSSCFSSLYFKIHLTLVWHKNLFSKNYFSAAYAARLDRQERGLSISDAIGDTNQSVVISNDPKTLRAENAQLRKQVEKINAARFTPLHPKETVKNIFFGQPYSLELYKSFTDKIALIDEALELGDGNAILAVSNFNL